MAVYNGAAYLKPAMDSVLNQTFHDLELLIINDGSTDESTSIINSYNDPRIRLLNNGKNKGIAFTRNRGVNEAYGELVATLDCDDIALPERIALQYRHMTENPQLALSGGHAEVIDSNGKPTGEFYKMPFRPHEVGIGLLFRNVFVNSTVMFRKEAIEELGGYKEMGICDDYELAFRISKLYPVDNMDKVLVRYRVHNHNISSEKEALMQQGEEQIVRYMHQSLGIPHDGRLLKTHLSFIRSLPEGPMELMDYFDLFKAFKIGNDIKGVFPKNLLHRAILMRWYEMIRQSGTKSSLSLFFKKPLFKVAYTTPKMYRKMIKQALGLT